MSDVLCDCLVAIETSTYYIILLLVEEKNDNDFVRTFQQRRTEPKKVVLSAGWKNSALAQKGQTGLMPF